MRDLPLSPEDLLALSADVLAQSGLFRFQARGGSMRPAIQDGDTLTLAPATPETLVAGDVVLYRDAGGRPVIHRIIARQEDPPRFTIRGDAQTGPSDHVSPDQVIGYVVDVQRGGGQRGRTALRLAMSLLQRLQSLRLYRAAARQLVGGRVTYRPVQPADSSALARLYGRPSLTQNYDQLIAHLDAEAGVILLACLGGRVAGAITVRRFPPEAVHYPDWWLFDLQVRLRYRGLGLGQGLVRAALAEAAARGARRVHLLVFAAQTPAIGLYEKLGFRRSTLSGLSASLAQETAAGSRPRLLMTCRLDSLEDA